MLSVLSKEELSTILVSMTGESFPADVSRDYLNEKLLNARLTDSLLTDSMVLKLVSEKLHAIRDLIVKLASTLPKEELELIAKRHDIQLKPKSSSLSISQALSGVLNPADLISEVVMPSFSALKRHAQIESAKKAKSGRSNLAIENIDKRTTSILDTLGQINLDIKDLQTSLKDALQELRLPSGLDLDKYLHAIRKEATDANQPVDASNLVNFFEKVSKALRVDEKTMFYLSLAYVTTHYSLQTAKSLKWEPTAEEFYTALSEALGSIKIIGNRAEVPSLRNAVCTRLGIDKGTFDKLLARAWREGKVSLETGAPVGEYNIEYLNVDGRKFFYVKLNG